MRGRREPPWSCMALGLREWAANLSTQSKAGEVSIEFACGHAGSGQSACERYNRLTVSASSQRGRRQRGRGMGSGLERFAFMGICGGVVHFMAILLLINFSVFALSSPPLLIPFFYPPLSPNPSTLRFRGMLLMASPGCYCCLLIWLLRLWILIIVHDLEDFPHLHLDASRRSRRTRAPVARS